MVDLAPAAEMAPMVPTMKYENIWFVRLLVFVAYFPKLGTFLVSMTKGLSWLDDAPELSRAADVLRARTGIVAVDEVSWEADRARARDALVRGAMTVAGVGLVASRAAEIEARLRKGQIRWG